MRELSVAEQTITGEANMTNSPQEPQVDPQTVEDLAPREDESAGLKGGASGHSETGIVGPQDNPPL